MKTLAVLSALVCCALAAPALPGDDTAGLEIIGNGIPETITRQKKSPQDTVHFPHAGASINFGGEPLEFNTEVGGSPVSARSHFGFKKSPIVVRKKTGYHVYRDSNEERAAAGPEENCGKQLRVKVCDESITAKASDLKRSTKDENVAMQNNDVESSIKIAKEAVESLQRDIQNIESDTTAKSAQWQHGKASDMDIHENIEVAQEALSHAQKHFGNLESMNMHETTFKEADVSKGKTEEERLAQWKQALETIQRNVEIARNIEDSFKSTDNQLLASEAIDTTKMMRSHGHDDIINFHKTTLNEGSTVISSHGSHNHNEDIKNHNLETKSEHHTTFEKMAHEDHNQEMKSSASEHMETKTLLQTHQNLRTSEKATETGHKTTETVSRTSENKNLLDTSMNHQMKNLGMEKDKTTNIETKARSESITKKAEISTLEEFQKEKSAWEDTEHKDIMMKAAEHNHMSHDKENHLHQSSAIGHVSLKSADHLTDLTNHNDKKSDVSLKTDMRLTDNLELGSAINVETPLTTQLNHEVELDVGTLNKGKSVETHKETLVDQARHSHLQSSIHHQPLVGQMHHHNGFQPLHNHHMHNQHMHMGAVAGHPTHISNIHLNTMVHGKSSDMDIAMEPSTQMSIREPMEKSALENLQWKHHVDAARSSYGAGYALGGGGVNLNGGAGLNLKGGALGLGAAGGESGAVGIFQNARVGGCAVPLLLSCSPSVVHGSLAKSHSSYTAPAYRANDFNFKKKRDTLKTKLFPEDKIKRTTVITKTEHLEKKL